MVNHGYRGSSELAGRRLHRPSSVQFPKLIVQVGVPCGRKTQRVQAGLRSGDGPPSVRARPSSLKRDCDRRTTSTGGKCLVYVHAKSRLIPELSAGTPVRNQGLGRSLPGPDAGHRLHSAGGRRGANCHARPQTTCPLRARSASQHSELTITPGQPNTPAHLRGAQRRIAKVTATAAANGYQQRPATAHNSHTIRANLAYARPEKQTVVACVSPAAVAAKGSDLSQLSHELTGRCRTTASMSDTQ